jgi:tetratricopeptide (TPR) repeat protein
MLNKIWQFLKGLIQHILGTTPPPAPPPAPRPTLTDAEYESKFMEILEGVNAGWSRGDVAGFLIAKRLRDGELAAWLRRFGTRLFEGEHDDTDATDAVASLQELARRLELLGRFGSGELSQVAGDIGREILTRFPLPVIEDDGGYGNVIEAVFVGNGLGVSGGGNRGGVEDKSDVDAEAKVWFDRGKDQGNSGDFKGAIVSYNQAIALKPDFDKAFNNRGIAQYNLGDFRGAIASYNQAITLKPDFHQAFNNRGLAQGNLGEIVEAIASYNQAIALKPDDHEAFFNRGNAQGNSGKFVEAIASYNQAIALKPDYHQAFFNRGNAQAKLGEIEEAIASYNEAIVFKPDFHEAFYVRGLAQHNLGEFIEAIGSYNQAIAIKPDFPNVFLNRGSAQDDLGEFVEAIASYNQAIALKPDYHEAFYNRGSAQDDLGEFVEAIASYNQAIALKPDYHEAFYNRGSAQDNLGEFVEAIASYNQAIALKPDFHQAFFNRGNAQGNLGESVEAIASFNQAIALKSDFHQAFNGRGRSQDKLGQIEEAIASYNQAISLKPDYHEAFYNRGLVRYKLGKFEDAIDDYNEAIVFQADLHQAFNNRGLAQDELGEFVEAIASYNQAIALKPNYHEAFYNRGNAQADLGELFEAIASYNQAIALKPDDHEIFFNRGNAQGNLGESVEAIASFNQAIALKSDFHQAFHGRGLAQNNLGLFEEAIVSYDTAITIKQDESSPWLGRGEAAGRVETQNNQSPFISAIAIQNPALNQRGYQGKLTSYEEGLKYVDKDKAPEGWGTLHLAIGRAHYSRWQSNPRLFPNLLSETINSYYLALQTLTKDAFPKLHLELLQDLIKALLRAQKTEAAHKLRRDATDLVHRLLQQQNYSQLSKQQLTDKLVSFQQLTVNIFMQSGEIVKALDTAELDKNVCLSWLLDALPIPAYQETIAETATHAQIQQLLNPTTCAIYWHLSDAALTTFIIKSDGLLSPENCLSAFPEKFEAWVKDWNQQYADYQDKSKEAADQQNHPWHVEMPSKFAQLQEMLQIPLIEEQLNLNGITDLILIPHRDLHRFPIHALFAGEFTISYLPSAQVGLNLKHRFFENTEQTHSLLSIENPDSTYMEEIRFPALPAAYIESEMICQMFSNPTRLGESSVTFNEVKKILQQQHSIFHFTGHGSYEFANPLESTLYLSKLERLTVAEIIHLNLSNYELICLSACETAVTANQNITSEYVGLVSGFMRAGAACVISTLWPVQSAASALFIIYFYQQWQETSLSKPEALAATQKWLRDATREDLGAWFQGEIDKLSENSRELSEVEDILLDTLEANQRGLATMEHKPYQHPYYWAAFTLTGLL